MNKIYNKDYFNNASPEEKQFLRDYDISKYERPSVTSDIVILTVDKHGYLYVVLVQRKEYPFKDKWALPGGFLKTGKESIQECAERELKEETSLENIFLEQLKAYSSPYRDPRTHVISIAHYALVPYSKINLVAGDDASDVDLFRILNYNFVNRSYPYQFYSPNKDLTFDDELLAFDHGMIIRDTLIRLLARKDDYLDLFSLLEDKNAFTIGEYQKIYEAITFRKGDSANFRKMFIRKYVDMGIVTPLDKKSETGKHAMLYSLEREVL